MADDAGRLGSGGEVAAAVDGLEQELLDYERQCSEGGPAEALLARLPQRTRALQALLRQAARPGCSAMVRTFEDLLAKRSAQRLQLSRDEVSCGLDAVDALRANLRMTREDLRYLESVGKGLLEIDQLGDSPAAASAAPAAAPATRPPAQAAPPHPLRILIADDEFVNRSLLLALLRPFGEMEVAVDGREAISAVEAAIAGGRHYDLLCLDIMMPHVDGQQVLVAVRDLEERAGIPRIARCKIVMTTALSGYEQIRRAFDRCDSYLVKPLAKGTLYRQLARLGFGLPAVTPVRAP
jgi:two-component system chemotaxis response regulator CheY